jgi:predicted N-acyltransferase
MLVTCPFFGHGGLYWDSESAREALLERAAAAARELGVDYIEIRHRERLPHPYQANLDFAEYDLALGTKPEETWKTVAPNVRQNVRKSQAADLEFRMVSDWAATYGLLCRTLRAHGTPFHGERFFRRVFARLGRSTRFSEVWHSGELVAAGIAIQYKDSMITPYIGSLERSRELRANYRQYWGLIEEHCFVQGIRRFEMGRSPRGSTHAQFKQKWGAEERQMYYNYLVIDPRRGYRSVSRPSAVQRLATQVWRRLPLFVTRTLGPRLFRNIP